MSSLRRISSVHTKTSCWPRSAHDPGHIAERIETDFGDQRDAGQVDDQAVRRADR